MPIQPGLALQLKGAELPDPMAQFAQATQIQNALQQQRMGEMQIQNAMREQQRAKELEGIMSGLSPTAPAADVAGQLQKRGFFQQAGQMLQQEATRRKTQREEEEAMFKAIKSKLELTGRLFTGVVDQATYSAAREKAIALGLGTLPEVYDPKVVKSILDGSIAVDKQLELEYSRIRADAAKSQAQSAERRAVATETTAKTAVDKAAFERANPGFTTLETDQGVFKVNKRTGAAEPLIVDGKQLQRTRPETKTELQRLQELRDTLPPGSVQRTEVENRIDALGRSAAPTLTEVVDPDDPTRMLKVDARVYTGGGFTAPGVVGIAGREPSAGKRATEQATGREQFLEILDNLQTNFDRLNQMRAIPSEQRGAVSNLLSSAEASGIGQVAGRAVGASAQSVRDEIKSSRMALLSALKKLTGKTASELNSNVELRLNLDAISDPSQSYEAAVKILDNLKQFYAQEPAATPAPGGRPGVTDRRSSAPRGAAPSGGAGKEIDFNDLPKGK